MAVKVTHTLIAGNLPGDGRDIEAALDTAAERGFYVTSTAICAVDENDTKETQAIYYVATLAQVDQSQEQKEAKRDFIGMGAGKSSPSAQASTHVDKNAHAEPGDTGQC